MRRFFSKEFDIGFAVFLFAMLVPCAVLAYFSTTEHTGATGPIVRINIGPIGPGSNQNCTGTVIGPRTVLTASHCGTGAPTGAGGAAYPDDFYVTKEPEEPPTPSTYWLATAEWVLPGALPPFGDFLILNFDTNLPFPFATRMGEPATGTDAWILGWGANYIGQSLGTAGETLTGDSLLLTGARWNNAGFGGAGGHAVIYESATGPDEGACGGDSGGSVWFQDANGFWNITGPLSSTANWKVGVGGAGGSSFNGCLTVPFEGGEYAVLARAVDYVSWIDSRRATAPKTSLVDMGNSVHLIGGGLIYNYVTGANVGTGSATVTCQAALDAQVNAVSETHCIVKSPSGVRHSCFSSSKITWGGDWDVWECNVDIPQDSESGTWTLDRIWTLDTAGNLSRASRAQIESSGLAVDEIQVVSPSEDVTGPAISAVTLSTTTPAPGASVTCTVTASDAASGLESTSCSYEASSGCTVSKGGNTYPCSSGCVAPGGGACSFTIPATATAGAWNGTAVARDQLLNMTRDTTTGDNTFTVTP